MLFALSAALAAHASGISGFSGPDAPQEFALRVGFTALVLLLALTFAPRLASVVSAKPLPDAAGTTSAKPVVETRAGASRWLRGLVAVSIWIAAVTAAAVVWLWGRSGFLPDSPRVLLTQAGYVLTRIAISLLVLAVALALGRSLDTGIELALERSHVNKNLLVLAGHAIYAATVIVGVIVILSVWGVSLVVPVTLIGVITVALSLALQDVLKNVVCGVYLLIERPFVIGDEITVAPAGAFTGIIEDIQIRVTHLRTVDGQLVLVPNATLFTTPVVNKSAYRRRRVGLAVSVPLLTAEMEQAAGTNGAATTQGAEGVAERILAAIRATAEVRAEPPPEVTLAGFSADKCDLRVTFWVPTGDPRRESGIVSAAIEQLRLQLPGAQITPDGSAPVRV
jgi:small-conductance mechanosensitive channel